MVFGLRSSHPIFHRTARRTGGPSPTVHARRLFLIHNAALCSYPCSGAFRLGRRRGIGMGFAETAHGRKVIIVAANGRQGDGQY